MNYPNGIKRKENKQESLSKEKQSKFKAKKTTILWKGEEVVMDSKKEAKRGLELLELERFGVIKNLRRQVPYVLFAKSKYGREIKYVADFVYECDGDLIVEDTKGFKTPEYRLKKRILAELKNIVIKES